MSKIIISASTSYLAEAATISLLNGGFFAKTARINYNLRNGLPLIEEYDQYPLILEGEMEGSSVAIHVFSVTAWYGGTGPRTLVNILKVTGLYFNPDDILTDKLADEKHQITLKLER